MDDDPAALIAELDQIGAIGRSYANELASFHNQLIERGIPAALAKQLTLTHQLYRYGALDSDDD
jgi:hypothetical protein